MSSMGGGMGGLGVIVRLGLVLGCGACTRTPPPSHAPGSAPAAAVTSADADDPDRATVRERTADAPRLELLRGPRFCDEEGECTGLRGCDFNVEEAGFPVVSADGQTFVFALRTEAVGPDADYGTLRIDFAPTDGGDSSSELVFPTLDDCDALYRATDASVRRLNAKLRGPWVRPRILDAREGDETPPEPGEAVMWLEEDTIIIERDGAELSRFADPGFTNFHRPEAIWVTPGQRTIAVQLREITSGHEEDVLEVIVLPTPPGLVERVGLSPRA